MRSQQAQAARVEPSSHPPYGQPPMLTRTQSQQPAGRTCATCMRRRSISASMAAFSAAMACTVLCSQDTLDACTAPVHTGRTQTVQVKGRAQAVQLHELLDLHGADDPRAMPSSQNDIHRSAPP